MRGCAGSSVVDTARLGRASSVAVVRPAVAACVVVAAWAAACNPTLDWREVRIDVEGPVAQFPCRPSTHARTVSVGGANVTMTMRACRADGTTFALAWFDVADPGKVEPALEHLRASAQGNVQADDAGVRELDLEVPGATPQRRAGRWRWRGRLPDGTAVLQEMALTARGTRVVQVATVRGAGRTEQAGAKGGDAGVAMVDERAQAFFAGLRWSPSGAP
jgi:hypothetical protein